jgi:hypothetical protein
MWRAQFSFDIHCKLVSFDNPTGKITNIDLELDGTTARNDVLVQFADLRKQTLHNLQDNTPAVSWQQKHQLRQRRPLPTNFDYSLYTNGFIEMFHYMTTFRAHATQWLTSVRVYGP